MDGKSIVRNMLIPVFSTSLIGVPVSWIVGPQIVDYLGANFMIARFLVTLLVGIVATLISWRLFDLMVRKYAVLPNAKILRRK